MQVIFLYYWSDLHNGFRLPRPSLEGRATTVELYGKNEQAETPVRPELVLKGKNQEI